MDQNELDAAVINRLTVANANLTLQNTMKDVQIEYLQRVLGEAQQQQENVRTSGESEKPAAQPRTRKSKAAEAPEAEVVEG